MYIGYTLYMLISIIIPAYNEEKTITSIIEKVKSVSLPPGIMREIIVVNDGSRDKTAEVLNSYVNDSQVKVFHKSNGGKTSALLLGFSKAAGDILLVQDADLEYDPNEYGKLLEPILKGEFQVVYGSRFLGKIQSMEPINRLANAISNWTFSLLWGDRITDINTCYKVFTRKAFDGITITAQNFAFETEVTIKFLKKGLKIKEIPIDYKARTREEGKKIRWSTALQMYWPILKYRFFIS